MSMRLGKTSEEQISQLTSQLEIASAEIQREIRERESLETELAEKTKILLAFSKYSLDLTFIFDVNSKFIYASPSVCKLTELSIDQIMDARLEAFFHTDDMKLVQSVIRSAVSTPGEVVSVPDFRVRHHDLRWLYFAGTAAYMQEVGAEGGIVFNLHDVTDRKKQENIIHRQANYDELTGLPNRMLFLDRLSQAILRSSREKHHVGILFIDLDGFKQINDTLGHSAGDELLRIIADRFRTCIRQDDTVARLGGDEFTVILPNITKPDWLTISVCKRHEIVVAHIA